jgi:hypothetical protein
MSELKIGLVGLGDQGAPMAEAISDALCLRDDEDIWNLIKQHRLTEALRSGLSGCAALVAWSIPNLDLAANPPGESHGDATTWRSGRRAD